MTWGLVVAGVGAVAGGYLASQGSKSAAETAAQGADAAAAEQGREFDITQQNTAPYRAAGQAAINRLGAIYGGGTAAATALPGYDPSTGNQLTPTGGVNQLIPGGTGPSGSAAPDYSNFYTSPDYNFTKTQGMQGIENSFSASGGAKSGNALKALADFNSNLAAGQFGNYFNRQAAIAGIGQTATGQVGAAGTAAGAQIGNSLIQGADARASGIAGQYNAYGNALGSAGQSLGYYLNNRPQNTNSPVMDPQGDEYVDWSDRRLKENINKIGETDAGLPIYRYTMKGTGEPRVGVMADEAKKKFPKAVKRDSSGYQTVNYLRIH